MIRKKKYAVLLAIIVFVVITFVTNQAGKAPFDSVEASLDAAVDTSVLVKADSYELKRLYGLNPADYEGVVLYRASFAMSAEEVLVIKTASRTQLEEVQAAIDRRLKSRKNDFEGYLPEEAKLISDAVVQVRGNYIFMIASANQDQYRKVLLKGL